MTFKTMTPFPPLPRKIRLQDAVDEPPRRHVRFGEVAGGHFMQKIHEAQGPRNGMANC